MLIRPYLRLRLQSLLVNRQMTTIQFNVRVQLKCSSDALKIARKQAEQISVANIAGRDQQQLVGLAIHQNRQGTSCQHSLKSLHLAEPGGKGKRGQNIFIF